MPMTKRQQMRVRNNRALETLQTGTYGATGEEITWAYYDETVIPATAGNIQMFQNPISGTKTIASTNMTSAGQIPQGQKFIIEEIDVLYRSKDGIASAADLTDMYKVLNESILQFKISNKAPMLQIKLSDVMGLHFMVPQFAAAGATASNAQNVFNGKFKLKTPLVIGALTPFAVEISQPVVPAASTVDDVVIVSLKGTLIRAL